MNMSKATINEYNYNHLMSEHELMAGILTYFNKHTHNVTHHTHTHTHTLSLSLSLSLSLENEEMPSKPPKVTFKQLNAGCRGGNLCKIDEKLTPCSQPDVLGEIRQDFMFC